MRLNWLWQPLPASSGSELGSRVNRWFQWSGEQAYAVDGIDGSLHPLPVSLLQALDACSEFGSLETLAHELHQDFNVGDATGFVRRLGREGHLFSSDQIQELETVKKALTLLNDQPIQRSLWVTRNRPEQLVEGVLSFGHSLPDTRTEIDFVVVDDSEEISTRAAVRSGLTEASAQIPNRVSLFSTDQRVALVRCARNACRDHRIPEKVAETLFDGLLTFGSCHGRNRNAALIISGRERVLWNDDDILARYAKTSRDDSPGLLLSSEFSAHVARSFVNREEAVQQAGLEQIDWATAHSQLLKPLAHVIAQVTHNGKRVSCTGASAGLIAKIRTAAKVVVTCAGVVGESAGKPPSSFLYWPVSWQDLPTAERETYYRHLLSGEVAIGAPAPVVTDSPFVPGTQIGLDLTETLPPFFPHFVGEDTIFGATLRALRNSWLVGHLDYGVFHDRRETRSYQRSDAVEPRFYFNLMTSYLLQEYDGGAFALNSGTCYAGVGSYLAGLGELSSTDFATRIRDVLARHLATERIVHEEIVRLAPDLPPWWKEDIKALEDNALQQIGSNTGAVPLEFRRFPVHLGLDLFRMCLRRFGEALIHWPDLHYCLTETSEKTEFRAVEL
jgi:hypothetical protein